VSNDASDDNPNVWKCNKVMDPLRTEPMILLR